METKQLLTHLIVAATLAATGNATALAQPGPGRHTVSTEEQPRGVLLEEFTGINCGYCPQGHAIAEKLATACDRVYVVAVHGGMFATPAPDEPDFRTDEGSQLISEFEIERNGYPSGMVNRHDFYGSGSPVCSRSSWKLFTKAATAEAAPVNLYASASFDGQYSSTSATATTATGGEVPYSPDFSKMLQNVAPMGWQADEDGFNLGQEYNGPYNISCRVMQADHTNGVEHSITSPWIKLADGSNRVLMDVNMTCYQGRVNAPYNNWEANDTVLVQVSADGEQFTTIYGMGPATRPYIADLDSYVTIRMPFDGFAGDKVKVRITWKTFTNPTFTIKNFTVEEKKDCDYPIDLHTVDGSVAGNVASIDWTRQGNENEWELRYKPAGSEKWSQTVQVLNKPFTFADLPGLTYIDVQLRAKCDASTHSEWSDTLTFRTGYTMPFTERFDATELPDGWEPRSGVLATPTVFDDGARTA